MFFFKNKTPGSSPSLHWFVGVHISSKARKLEAAVRKITDAVILPGPLDHKGTPRSNLRGEKERPRSDKLSASHGGSEKRSEV